MYCDGLGWDVLAEFGDHDGFDGAMVGDPDAPYHFEFTMKRAGGVAPTPTAEDLVVLYLPTVQEWQRGCATSVAVGFVQVASANPYWSARGKRHSKTQTGIASFCRTRVGLRQNTKR
jgi:hypothetical protein